MESLQDIIVMSLTEPLQLLCCRLAADLSCSHEFKKHFSNFVFLTLDFFTRSMNDSAGAQQEKSVWGGKCPFNPSIFSTTIQPFGFICGAH